MKLHAKLFAIVGLFLAQTVDSAHADARVFLLQLGSFESKEDAQARWTSLRGTYPDLLEGLSVRLLDVVLPPDDFTVYRTQAGVLENRSDAQIICDKLNEKGDECYVVETAMFQGQDEVIAEAPQPQPQPSQQAAMAAMPAEVPEPQPLLETPAALAQPVLPDAQPEVQAMPMQMPPQADVLAVAEADEMPALAAVPSAELSAEPSAMPSGAGLEPLQGESDSSFWSWLNPFSDEDDAAESAESVPALVAQDNPEEGIQMTAVDRGLLPPPPANPADVSPVASLSPEQPDVPALLLPEGQQPPAEMAMAAEAPVMPMPDMQTDTPSSLPPHLPFQVKHRGKLVTQADQAASNFVTAGDEVRVAEAVRVPVKDVARMGPQPYETSDLRALGMPSEPVQREKNLWAEIRYFTSRQEALAFWNTFRKQNSGFPPVRVRVTSPYQSLRDADTPVSLRVGPFAVDEPINTICAQVRGENASCDLVREMGASATNGWQRGRNQARRVAEQRNQDAQAMYWVQLGSFASQQEAQAAWEALRLSHAPALDKIEPTISDANSGSALHTAYRLRTGPYVMRPAADALCAQLKSHGGKCLTVFSN